VFPDAWNLHIILPELASLVLIFSFLELLTPQKTMVFWVMDSLLSIFFLANVMYYSHFGSILGLQAISQAVMLKDIGSSIFELFSRVYLLFFLDIFLFLIISIFPKRFKKITRTKYPINRKPVLAACLFTLFFSFFCLRNYPAKDNMIALAQDTGIFNAQFYEIYSSFHKSKDVALPTNKFNQASINELKQIAPVSWPKYYGAASGKNIILVQLESTENFVIGVSLNDQEVTPNLNRLLQDSMYFPRFYSQIGQGNTSDAEFLSNTSFYPLSKGSITDTFENIEFPSLPRLLKTKGYISVTFHPNDVTFWNRDNLYPCLGFDRYYDKKFYQNEDQLGPWGSSDEMLFKKAIPILLDYKNKNQKFYASFITLTNHHPYNLPDKKKRLKLPSSLSGTLLGNYLTSVNYEDYALGLFFEDLKANKLWDDSVLIIYGDHFGISQNDENLYKKKIQELLGREHNIIDRLNIPLFLRVPGLKPQIIKNIGGQVDILPTLANLLGLPLKQRLVFGQDILNNDHNLLGFRYFYPEGTFISSQLFHLGGKTGSQQEEQRIKTLMQLSDSYLQSLAK